MRIEPPPSVAVAIGTKPAASADADPPLEPPGLRAVFQGLRVTPYSKFAVYPSVANSDKLVFPMMIAPAARKRAGTRPSCTASGLSLIHISEPTRRTPISYAV